MGVWGGRGQLTQTREPCAVGPEPGPHACGGPWHGGVVRILPNLSGVDGVLVLFTVSDSGCVQVFFSPLPLGCAGLRAEGRWLGWQCGAGEGGREVTANGRKTGPATGVSTLPAALPGLQRLCRGRVGMERSGGDRAEAVRSPKDSGSWGILPQVLPLPTGREMRRQRPSQQWRTCRPCQTGPPYGAQKAPRGSGR